MALVVCPHPRVEALVEALAATLQARWPEQALEPVPIVVGTRGMETWLRHALTTAFGSLSSVEFAFPSAALEGASAWLRGEHAGFEPESAPRARFWAPSAEADAAWHGEALAARTLTAVRACLAEQTDDMAPLRDYLRASQAAGGGAVEPLEHELAAQIATALERWLHDRPEEASQALRVERTEPDPQPWIGRILRALHHGPHAARSPLTRFEALRALPTRSTGRVMFVFGLSTLRPGDLLRLEQLGRFMEIHLFVMAPSAHWLGDLKSPDDVRAIARFAPNSPRAERARAEARVQNSLLAANAGPTRDLQAWVFSREGDDVLDATSPDAFEPLAHPKNVLEHLQRWIADASDRTALGSGRWTDEQGRSKSVERHSTRGPLRQCEALRDALLARFASDPTLQARHVVVMTPDLATYAPLVAAVFGRSNAQGAPALPVTIADLGLRSTNPLADAVLAVLALTDARVTASALADLVTMEPVRARFGLSEDEARDAVELMRSAGLRWGWDAVDRAGHGSLPKTDQNTVRFALERFALGALMPDEGGLGVVQGSAHGDSGWGAAAPLALSTQDRIATVSALIALVDAVEAAQRSLATAATPATWRSRLMACVDALTAVPPKRAWQRLEVLSTLEQALPDAPEAYAPQAVAALLSGAFDLPQRGDRVFGGSITLCALEPMRSVPFRVVALLGMDDNAFPRQVVPSAWDPMATPKRGESDRRTIDRHLFLEAVMSARDALLVFYTGFEPKQDKPQPPSVVVDELFEVVEKAAPEKYAAAVEQPLQPWSERRFKDERTRPYDDFLVRTAEARRGAGERLTARTPRQLAERPRLPARLHPKTALTTGDLTSALTRPQYMLLKGRLGIELHERDQTLEDREPIEPGTYDVSNLAEELAPLWSAGGSAPPIEALEARLRAEGKLLVGEAGRMHLRAVASAVNAVVEERSKLAGALLEPHQYRVRLEGGVEVSTPLLAERLQTENGVVLVQRVYQKKLQEHVWVQAVYDATVAQASLEGEGRVFAVLVTTDGLKPISALGQNAAEARAALERTAALWERAHSEAVLLFKSTSQEIGAWEPQAVADIAEMSAAVLAAHDNWHGSSGSKGSVGERDKPWVKPLFGDLTIEDLAAPEVVAEVVALAQTHWGPVLDALGNKRRTKKKPSSGKDKTASDTEGAES